LCYGRWEESRKEESVNGWSAFPAAIPLFASTRLSRRLSTPLLALFPGEPDGNQAKQKTPHPGFRPDAGFWAFSSSYILPPHPGLRGLFACVSRAYVPSMWAKLATHRADDDP